MSVEDVESRATPAVKFRYEHRIKGERQQFAPTEFDAIPVIERRHQPVGIPKQPFADMLTRFDIGCTEGAERIREVFKNCWRLHENPPVMLQHRHLTPTG